MLWGLNGLVSEHLSAQRLAQRSQYVVSFIIVIFLVNMASLLSKGTWSRIMNAGNTTVGSYFEHQLSLTLGKLLKFLFLTGEGRRPGYTVCMCRNRYGHHLLLWNVYISKRFLNNFIFINVELGHSVFNKYPPNNSTFVSTKRVLKFCFDLILGTLSSLLTVCADCWWSFQRNLLPRCFGFSPRWGKRYYCSVKFDRGKLFGQFVLH